jgi:hypothetical protein
LARGFLRNNSGGVLRQGCDWFGGQEQTRTLKETNILQCTRRESRAQAFARPFQGAREGFMAHSSSLAAGPTDQGRRYFQQGTALNRVLLEAPFLARCSDDKTAARVRPRQYAIRYPYMQVNRPGMVSWLIFDLDHAHAFAWEDADLPAPNLIVRNRTSGHSHLFYAIPPVCTTQRARSKPIEFMRAVYEAMATRLDADPQFHSGPVAKTPGHPWWLTHELHGHVYELGELADYVDLPSRSPWGRKPDLDAVAHSRHCSLFEALRFYAYSIVQHARDQGGFEGFARRLEAFAHRKNRFRECGFAADLPLSSIKATVKSVARWTWDRYRGSGRCHVGVMQLDPGLPLAERQRLAGLRSGTLRRQATEESIRAACRQLHAQGKPLTQVAVARLAGITRQTVAAHRHLLVGPARSAPVVLVARPKLFDRIVKCTTHQVTAVAGGCEEGDGNGGLLGVEAVHLPEPSS